MRAKRSHRLDVHQRSRLIFTQANARLLADWPSRCDSASSTCTHVAAIAISPPPSALPRAKTASYAAARVPQLAEGAGLQGSLV